MESLCCQEIQCQVFFSVLSSLLTLLILFLLAKPRIKVSKKIAKENNEAYRIKVINKSWFFSYVNIQAELHIITTESNGLKKATNIHLTKRQLFHLDRNLIYNKDYNNAYRFKTNTNIDNLISGNKKGFKCLRFKIIATHSFSNFSKVKVVEYDKSGIINGEFEVGNTMKIVK